MGWEGDEVEVRLSQLGSAEFSRRREADVVPGVLESVRMLRMLAEVGLLRAGKYRGVVGSVGQEEEEEDIEPFEGGARRIRSLPSPS